MSSGRRSLTEPEAYSLISKYGIPTPWFGVAQSAEEAASIACSIGYPVVLKIVSPDILHKSDVGGVRVGISSEEALRRAFEEILSSVSCKCADARIDGVLVAGMVAEPESQDRGSQVPTTEVIIGAVKDPEFGHAVMFGLGGIFVEIMRDVASRVTPIQRSDAYQMMSEIKAASILEGVRGNKPRDREALADIILAVSRMVEEHTEITSIDLNPVMVFDRGACVADAKITL